MGSRVDTSRGKWDEPSADDIEINVRMLVQRLMRCSVKLGRLGTLAKGSKEYRDQRDRIADDWARFQLGQLRAQITKETKRATRAELHHQLCEIARAADADVKANERPHVAWKREIERVISWLDTWAR
jgi:hypothetical protein